MKKKMNIKTDRFCVPMYETPLVANDVQAYELNLHADSDLTDCSLLVTALRADGTVVCDTTLCEKNRAVYVLENGMYAVPGDLTVRLAVIDADGSCLTTHELLFTVLEGHNTETIATTETPAVTKILLELSDLRSAVREGKSYTDEQVLTAKRYSEAQSTQAVSRANTYTREGDEKVLEQVAFLDYLLGFKQVTSEEFPVSEAYNAENQTATIAVPSDYSGVSSIIVKYTGEGTGGSLDNYAEIGVSDGENELLYMGYFTEGETVLDAALLYKSLANAANYVSVMTNGLQTVSVMTENPNAFSVRLVYLSEKNILAEATAYTDEKVAENKAYTDEAIQKAIIDSWEVAI